MDGHSPDPEPLIRSQPFNFPFPPPAVSLPLSLLPKHAHHDQDKEGPDPVLKPLGPQVHLPIDAPDQRHEEEHGRELHHRTGRIAPGAEHRPVGKDFDLVQEGDGVGPTGRGKGGREGGRVAFQLSKLQHQGFVLG